MPKHRHTKKNNPLRFFLEYGFHLWILLFVSNLLIFYSFRLFSFGAEKDTQLAQEVSPGVSITVSPEAVSPTIKKPIAPAKRAPTPKPNGPVISLSFSIPGIGSGGGTLRPSRTKRSLTVYLYATDVNSTDNKVKPLYSIRTTADFDDNEFSPTYTSFVNKNIELGDTVKNGKYQIAFITEQSLRKLVKDKEDAIGGKIVNISRFEKAVLPLQRVIMGDMAPPQGNNVMDINDYTVLVDCFGQTPTSCIGFKQADLNDDGLIDGIDYNIMALGFKELIAQGFPPPQLPTPIPSQVKRLSELEATPKISPTIAPSASPSPVPVKTTSNPLSAVFGFLFFMLILGGGGVFVASRTKFGKAFLATHPLPFLKAKVDKKDTPPTAEGEPSTSEAAPTETTPEAIAESTEIPIEQAEAEKAAPATTDPNAVDKTYYVKHKSKDDKGTWVTLTDDAGPVDGLLPTGEIEDGFERIKGTFVEENGKKYVLINEILPSE